MNFEELKAIQDTYLEMKQKDVETLTEEQVSTDRKLDKNGRKIPARRIVNKDSKDYVKEENVEESARADKKKSISSMLDRMYAKADANTKLSNLKQQNVDKKKLPEEVESLEELSSDLLSRYKTKAAKSASDSDKEGNFSKGNKRFSGIIKATKKQFKNDVKEEVELDEAFDVHNKIAFKRAEMKHELGHEDKPSYGKSNKTPKLVSMHFYNVPKDKEDLAASVNVKKTKSGKWALSKYNTSGVTHSFQKQKADEHFGKGALWEPKKVNEEVESTNFMTRVLEALNSQRADKLLDEESLNEARAKKEPMEVYHTGYSAALQHAEKHLNKQGYEIHPDDWQQHISHGPSKPAEGKTNQLHIPLHKDGKPSKKVAHIQVYNRGNEIPKNNELNMYVN